MEFIYSLLHENFIEGGQIALKFFSDPREFLFWSETYRPDLILTGIDMTYFDGKKLESILHATTKHILLILSAVMML
jgi:PleD family two-component response regulator